MKLNRVGDSRGIDSESAPPTNGSWQFSLRTLFALPLFVGVFFALVHWVGVCLAVLPAILVGLLLACCYAPARDYARRLLGICFFFAVIAFLLPVFPHSGEAARRCQCCNNLKQIALGLQNYHDAYGNFRPPSSPTRPASPCTVGAY